MTEDEFLRDMLVSSQSIADESIKDDSPTIMSLLDTVTLIENKYGTDWRCHPECKCTVIWASRNFNLDHVKEVVPDLYDLCKEYKEKDTVNGKKFDPKFYILAFHIVHPNTDKI